MREQAKKDSPGKEYESSKKDDDSELHGANTISERTGLGAGVDVSLHKLAELCERERNCVSNRGRGRRGCGVDMGEEKRVRQQRRSRMAWRISRSNRICQLYCPNAATAEETFCLSLNNVSPGTGLNSASYRTLAIPLHGLSGGSTQHFFYNTLQQPIEMNDSILTSYHQVI